MLSAFDHSWSALLMNASVNSLLDRIDLTPACHHWSCRGLLDVTLDRVPGEPQFVFRPRTLNLKRANVESRTCSVSRARLDKPWGIGIQSPFPTSAFATSG